MAGTRVARSAHRQRRGWLEHDSARLGIRARTTQGRASSGRYGQAQGDGEQALAARRDHGCREQINTGRKWFNET